MATYDDVQRAFTDGSVLTASKEELEQLLLAITTARILAEENRAVAAHRGETIRLLLSVRQSQRFHSQAIWVSVAALVVALASLGITAVQLFLQLRTS